MADRNGSPSSGENGRPPSRRVRIERNLYERPDGVLELGYRDSTGKQRWQRLGRVGIKQARAERDALLGARGKGERIVPSPRLRFGQATERWLAEEVAERRPSTHAAHGYAVKHALKRWQNRRLDAISADDCAQLVRRLRAEGLAGSYIASVLGCADQVFRFARRRLRWQGSSPVADLLSSERPRAGSPERRVYVGDELAQTIAATGEPWATLFRLAAVVGGRESELLGLWWENLVLADVDRAAIAFTHQVDRRGVRVPLKTDESKAVLPLPRATALMMLEHKARSLHTGPRAFVFATRTGRAISQRNLLRALYRAQEQARDGDGRPTFPDLFEHDEHGHLVVDAKGRFVVRQVKRRELDVPDFHAIRHCAAMDCEDVEEARDLLRHKNSNVTASVYRAHFGDRRREALRARMEARLEAADVSRLQHRPVTSGAEVVDLREVRDAAQ
jgi:integrase